MAYAKIGERWESWDIDKPWTAEAELADRIAVIYGTSEAQVDVPEFRGQQCAGLTKVEQGTVYASGDTNVSLFKKGRIRYTAGDAHAVGTKLAIYGITGTIGTARDGDHVIGVALKTVATAADYGLIDLQIPGFRLSREQLIPTGAMTDDSEVTLGNVAGDYAIELLWQTTLAGIAAGIDVGTTDGGAEILSAGDATQNGINHAFFDATTDAIVAGWFTLTANDSLFITDTSGGWNSSSITMYIKLTRLS